MSALKKLGPHILMSYYIVISFIVQGIRDALPTWNHVLNSGEFSYIVSVKL